MPKHVCDTCPHFTRQFGVKLDSPFSVGGEMGMHAERHYDAMGLGICSHPDRPRGLMPSYFKDCPDWGGQPAIRDITPAQRRLRGPDD